MEFRFNGPSGTLRVALALLVGLGTLGYGAYSYSTQSAAMDSAVAVNATIVSTTVETSAARRGTNYRPQATFNFTYEGDSYTVSNLYPGPLPREFGSESEARAQLAGYTPGDTVTAYVPPDAPETAFLKHESSTKPLLVMGFGAFVVLATVVSFLNEKLL